MKSVNYSISFNLPQRSIEQTSQKKPEHAWQEPKLILHIKREYFIRAAYSSRHKRIAVFIHGIDCHANNPGETEEDAHCRDVGEEGPPDSSFALHGTVALDEGLLASVDGDRHEELADES